MSDRVRLEAVAAAHAEMDASADELAEFASAAGVDVSRIGDDRLADLYLVCACARGDPAATANFTNTYGDQIRHIATRYLSDQSPEDFVQTTLVHLLAPREDKPPRIAAYAGAGALKAFVRMVATRLAVDTRRALSARPTVTGPVSIEDAFIDPLERKETRERLTTALGDALGALEPSERRALRLRFVLGFSLARTARALDVHPVSVSRMVARARMRVLEGIRERLQDLPGNAGALQAIANSLDISIAGYLDTHPDVEV